MQGLGLLQGNNSNNNNNNNKQILVLFAVVLYSYFHSENCMAISVRIVTIGVITSSVLLRVSPKP